MEELRATSLFPPIPKVWKRHNPFGSAHDRASLQLLHGRLALRIVQGLCIQCGWRPERLRGRHFLGGGGAVTEHLPCLPGTAELPLALPFLRQEL